MTYRHSLLKRQIKRHLGKDKIPPEWESFLHAVDSAYEQFDDDREMLERSLELSSQELMEANSGMKALLADLEQRVDERTSQLQDSYEQLLTEVAERKRAEAKYRDIFENAVEGMFQTSPEGKLINANVSLAKLFGYDSPEEIIEKIQDIPSQLYVRAKDREQIIDQLQNQGVVEDIEVEMLRRDGSHIWCSIRARALFDTEGRFNLVEGMLINVSARRKARQALTKAKEEAEEASRIKSNFLSMVSHELRTPLTSILGFSKVVLKRLRSVVLPAMAEQEEKMGKTLTNMENDIGIIISEGERLTELINNVLDLSRLETGKFNWNMGALFIADVVDHSLAAVSVLAEEKGLTLEREVEEDLPPVIGDKDRLVQVLINLLSNSVKFTDKGRITCKAFYERRKVCVSVTDTGIGIPPAKHTVIFDRFKQLGDTMRGKPKGTGLGLAISQEIIEHHGGRIWVESEPGKGSTFIFTLPQLELGHA